jgi:ATP-dependent HslUV protease ATP-binding subunit HslU
MRSLSNHTESPFIKVEATQYTEVGYHGKDVENMVIDLMKIGMAQMKRKINTLGDDIKEDFEMFLDLIILELFVGHNNDVHFRREKLKEIQLGYYNYRNITIPKDFIGNDVVFTSFEEYFKFLKKLYGRISFNIDNDFKRTTIKSFRSILKHYLIDNIENRFDINTMAKTKVENEGIIFIDEIDKIVNGKRFTNGQRGPSTDGVQRDLLPIVEGTQIKTQQGMIKTNSILFVTAGAFSETKPEELLPELLGREKEKG